MTALTPRPRARSYIGDPSSRLVLALPTPDIAKTANPKSMSGLVVFPRLPRFGPQSGRCFKVLSERRVSIRPIGHIVVDELFDRVVGRYCDLQLRNKMKLLNGLASPLLL